jgi:hypothetical protein
MGSTESWIYRREDGAVVLHVENDGWYAVRHGLEPVRDSDHDGESRSDTATKPSALHEGEAVASRC